MTYIDRGPLGFLFVAYFVMSVATFIAYALDKAAARNGTWRITEATLHTMALLCGWPGALLGQRLLRHKTQKRPFREIFGATVIVNCTGLALLLNQVGGFPR